MRASIIARPNPIEVNDATPLAVTTLAWESEVVDTEVRVGSPVGPLLSRGSRSGEAVTGQWVTDGLTFFLCDASPSGPLGRDRTLASVVVRVNHSFVQAGIILMYHRVATLEVDPWSLAVTPSHFSEHLATLRPSGFEPISLPELAKRLAHGKSIERAIVVTFDDGYADNLSEAAPLLERHNVPATVFVASGRIGQPGEFWWDTLNQLLLAEQLPSHVTLKVHGRAQVVDLSGDEPSPAANRGWRVSDGASTPRQRLYCWAHEALRPLSLGERDWVISELIESTGLGWATPGTNRQLTADELAQLARHHLFDVGSHTVNHPALPGLRLEAQRFELSQSRSMLEGIVGRPVTMFAYPYGCWSAETRSLVRHAGYSCACSAEHSVVSVRADPLLLPRLMVSDWNGAEFQRRLTATMPRKT